MQQAHDWVEHFAGASAVMFPVDIPLLLRCCTLPLTADAASSIQHSKQVISFVSCAEFDHMNTSPLFDAETLVCSSYPGPPTALSHLQRKALYWQHIQSLANIHVLPIQYLCYNIY